MAAAYAPSEDGISRDVSCQGVAIELQRHGRHTNADVEGRNGRMALGAAHRAVRGERAKAGVAILPSDSRKGS